MSWLDQESLKVPDKDLFLFQPLARILSFTQTASEERSAYRLNLITFSFAP